METRKTSGLDVSKRHSHSHTNLPQVSNYRSRDRLFRRASLYSGLAAVAVFVLLYRNPFQQQPQALIQGRIVVDESFRGYIPQLLATTPTSSSQQPEMSLFRRRHYSTYHASYQSSGTDEGSNSVVKTAGTPLQRIWLYSLIPADYDGAAVLPHWVQHYLDLGIRRDDFLVLINHNPAKYSRDGLSGVVQVLDSFGIGHRVWEGQYSSDQHLKQKLLLFNQVVAGMEDWILIADSDEFQDYGGMPIPLVLGHADAQGATYLRGDMIDRLALDGAMPPVVPAPSIYQQFPLQCQVVSNLYGGKTKKIVAFKAFLRSNQGNHKMVPPEKAQEYFGPAEEGQLSQRGGYFGAEDLYPLTPYSRFRERYVYRGVPISPEATWDDQPYALSVTVLHFKWHAAVLRNMQDRVKFYKGSADEGGLPRYKHYHEAEKVVEALTANGNLNLTGLHCSNTLLLQQRRQQVALQAQQQQQQQQQQHDLLDA